MEPLPSGNIEELFATHRTRLEAFATNILRDADEARDVTSDSFVALLERGPADCQSAVPWLFTTVRNRALNRLRSRTRAARRLPLLYEHPDDVIRLDDLRTLRLLTEALERLSPRDALALRIRYLDDVAYPEVAQRLGTTVGHARVIVHRAAVRLRREVTDALATHHRLDPSCRDALGTGTRHGEAQRGCRHCTLVADELDGLLGRPSVGGLVLESARRRLSVLGARTRSFEVAGRVAQVGTGIAESLVAGAVAAALIATGNPPSTAATTAAHRATPSAILAAGGNATATARRHAPTRLGSSHERLHEVASTELSTDAGNDHTATGGVTPVVGGPLSALPIRLDLRDTLDPEQPSGADIRSFRAVTLADQHGTPRVLRFVVTTAGRPTPTTTFSISWYYQGNQCSSMASIDPASSAEARRPARRSATLDTSCPDSRGLPTITAATTPTSIAAVIDGRSTIIDLHFADRRDDARRLLAPGCLLTTIVVSSNDTSVDQARLEYDTAPDAGEGARYRIQPARS